jgi:isoprenylcysteine carboxyl methyltransferase (ICMT) family protein YpbQ
MPQSVSIDKDALEAVSKQLSKQIAEKDGKSFLFAILASTCSIVLTVVSCAVWAVRQLDQIWTVKQEAESWRQVVRENPTIKPPDIYAIHEK